MAQLTTTLNSSFTPTTTAFSVDVVGGICSLFRTLPSSTTWVEVGKVHNRATIVENPTTGCAYKLVQISAATPTIQAYE